MKLVITDPDGSQTAVVEFASDAMLTESASQEGRYVLVISGPTSADQIPEPIRVPRGGGLYVESNDPPEPQ